MTTTARVLVVAFGLLATGVTFVASRGKHSPLHYFTATWAIAMGIVTIICGTLGFGRASMMGVVGIAACFVTVFLTDRRDGLTPAQYALRVLKTGWRQRHEC